MPTTKRKQLLRWAQSALDLLEQLDAYLCMMDKLQEGRQPAIPEAAPLLLEMHELCRVAWKELKSKL